MATPQQVRRRGRFGLLVGTVVATLMLAAVAYADAPENLSVLVKGSEATNTYTNTTSVKVDVYVEHCPPGGDMDALAVDMRNSTSDAWTEVKAGGTDWPQGNCTGSATKVPPADAAEFNWTLASGADGTRTVYVRVRHGGPTTSVKVEDSDSIILDTTAPTISDHGPTPSSPNGTNGWYTSAVSNLFSASDSGSGLSSSCTTAFPLNTTTNRNEKSVSTGSNEGSSVKVNSGECSDVAGNTNNGVDSAAFKIDLSDPNVAITAPSDGASTSDSSITLSGTASDDISGVVSVRLTVNGSALASNATLGVGTWSQSGVALQCGTNTIKATATDNAGRTKDSAQITVTRNCVSYTFSGFHGGVDPDNKAKAGQSISLRWNLYDGAVALANEITSTSGHTLNSTKITCLLVGEGDSTPAADDAGSSGLRYDTFATPTANASGQFVFVWKTNKDWANTCRRFDVTYGGVTLSAQFRFTK